MSSSPRILPRLRALLFLVGAHPQPRVHPPATSSTATSTTESVNAEIEAEDGIMSGPMERAADNSASSGMYVWVRNGGGSGGSAKYSFEVSKAGKYIIWGRVLAPNNKDDSFFRFRGWRFGIDFGIPPYRQNGCGTKSVIEAVPTRLPTTSLPANTPFSSNNEKTVRNSTNSLLQMISTSNRKKEIRSSSAWMVYGPTLK